MTNDITAKVHRAINEIGRAAWNGLLDEKSTPFMHYDFLESMEAAGAVRPQLGWLPLHLSLWRGSQLIGLSPGYLKGDSMGDFSRDWNWSHAFTRAGLAYYPKYVVGVPFTPVPGRRFLVAQGEDAEMVAQTLARVAFGVAKEHGMSSVQVLYHDEGEVSALEAAHYIPRISFQFHWQNKGYESRDCFLATLKSKRRTALKREWGAPAKQGISVRTIRGDELRADSKLWSKRVYDFYERTVSRYMWRDPYLNQRFYELLFERMGDAVEVVAAFDDRRQRFLGGAFNMTDGQRLYGRYWGAFEDIPFLHFNVCMYHSIDECIQLGRQAFEGGEGGPHKLKRGFEPTLTRSAFRFVDEDMHRAVSRYLAQERAARLNELKGWMEK